MKQEEQAHLSKEIAKVKTTINKLHAKLWELEMYVKAQIE